MGRKPWDQQPNEGNAAYSHFLAYRNLGPARSLDKAYQVTKGNKTLQAPGSWAKESERFQWVDRAHQWDIHNLLHQGEETATLYMGAMRKHAFKLIEALDTLEPERYDDAIKGMELLAKLFPPDVLAALISSRADGGERDDV